MGRRAGGAGGGTGPPRGPGKSAATWRGSPWRKALWGGAALLLLAPLVAMRFTNEVVWGPLDFAVFGAMLASACGAFDLAAGASGDRAYLAAAAVAVGTAFLLVWTSLAVGVIGEEGDPANLMFAAVLGIGAAGAFLARFRPGGMARALLATALAQAAASAVAAAFGWGLGGAVLSALFVGPWLASAWLFRRAGR